MYHEDYEPQHPMLKQMRQEQALMDSLPEPMRISSDLFEDSAACKYKKGGLFGFGGKIDPNNATVKAWIDFYKKNGCCLSMPSRSGKMTKEAKERNAQYTKKMDALTKKTGCFIQYSKLEKAGLLED